MKRRSSTGPWIHPGIKPRSPTLQPDSLPAEPPGKPKNTGMGSLFLLQGIFPTQDRTRVSCIAGRFFTSWATSIFLVYSRSGKRRGISKGDRERAYNEIRRKPRRIWGILEAKWIKHKGRREREWGSHHQFYQGLLTSEMKPENWPFELHPTEITDNLDETSMSGEMEAKAYLRRV